MNFVSGKFELMYFAVICEGKLLLLSLESGGFEESEVRAVCVVLDLFWSEMLLI